VDAIKEEELVRRLVDGDESALIDVLRILGPRIDQKLRAKFRRHLNEFDREDILAHAIMKLWENRATLDPNRGLFGYLVTVANHRALDLLHNTQQRIKALEVELDSSLESRGTLDEIPLSDEKARTLADLEECLNLLPEKARRILIADATSPNGIASSKLLASELGVAESSIRVYRKRALERLRGAMWHRIRREGGTPE
jgi:RNA polymerase sigma factor (sigma-70 family)